jgi:predicted extracellular nuclease
VGLPTKRVTSVLAGLVATLLLTTTVAHAQPPNLSVSDVALAEGDPPGTTTFTFAVTLTSPASTGVTFDIATADGTAQDDNPVSEDNDYVAQSVTGQTIPAGSTGPYNFTVTVNRDPTVEPTQTFFVNVTNVTGANVVDGQGLGTIQNDDVTITPIHDIQGPGASSPLSGSVTIRAIVIGVKSNGFFVQEEEADYDADPNTSEGIFVFTSSAPPAAAAVAAQVQVTGTISEFVPSGDPLDPPSTQLTSPTVLQLSTGNPLPAPVTLTATFPDPAGPFDQLERVEHMRVSVGSITASGPSQGSINEADATGTNNGRFHGVVTGVARPFREAGIQAPDPPPSGSIPPIPRWDFNPERIRVESAGLAGQPALTVRSGDVVGPLVGPLDYRSRAYAIHPDGTNTPVVTPGTLTTTVSAAAGHEVTIASFNLQGFFDTVNDPAIGEPVLTQAAYDTRLAKASIAIRQHLRHPDIVAVQEVDSRSCKTSPRESTWLWDRSTMRISSKGAQSPASTLASS